MNNQVKESRMLRRVTTSVIAAAALIGVAAAPANALIFGTNEGPESERGAVVRVHMLTEGGVAECTGTAVSAQWVLTAQHCIEGLATDDQGRISGMITTGEGALGSESVRSHQVNAVANAYEADNANGDVPLIHVTEPMDVTPAEINYGDVVGQPGTAYGWSNLGTGATGTLPGTAINVEDKDAHPLYEPSQAYLTTSTRPAQLQQGDSGGPLFVDGEVAGVLSVGIGSIINPVLISATYMHAKMEGLQGWVDATIATTPTNEPGEMPEVPGGGIGSLIPMLPVIPGSAEINDIIGGSL